MTIETMQDNVVRKWGFEHPATIFFFEECERLGNDVFFIEISYWFAINWKE